VRLNGSGHAEPPALEAMTTASDLVPRVLLIEDDEDDYLLTPRPARGGFWWRRRA
jgi:hypothetical protein